ncbi:MAG: hypothetical protein K5876_03090 [Ruminiclostridium sp.]|nr:hypothetical protein [Ruminiclostridium sp.]
MKKRMLAALAAVLILAAAGCNNGSAPANTTAAPGTTSASTQGAVTQIAMEASIPDTSNEALAYLEGVVPLFKNYLVKRRTTPMTLETSFSDSEGEWLSSIYIKDDHNAVMTATNPSGTVTTTVYSVDKGFQLDPANKKAYIQEFSDSRLTSIVSSLLIRISESEVKAAQYSTGTGTIEGTEYNCESITVEDSETVYYFKKDTGDLAYIKDGDTLTKIIRLENVFEKDDMLTIPADYEQLSYKDLVALQDGGSAETTSSAE